jgi:chondroitin 4-sulfotransferase 11
MSISALARYLPIPARNSIRRLLCPNSPARDDDFLLPVERRRKFIFFHIPKTGGNSICDALFDGQPVNHRLYVRCEQADPVTTRRFFKFCILRDPLDRFLSAYNFLIGGGMTDYDRAFHDRHLVDKPPLVAFLNRFREDPAVRNHVHFLPQGHFITDRRGRVRMDYLGRFDQLEASFDAIARRIGVAARLPHRNASHRRELADSLSADAIHFLRGYYCEDMRLIESAGKAWRGSGSLTLNPERLTPPP